MSIIYFGLLSWDVLVVELKGTRVDDYTFLSSV